MDTDSIDLKNPLAVVEYVDDIHAYYRKIKISCRVSPNYMDHQPDIDKKMRAILIDWLIEFLKNKAVLCMNLNRLGLLSYIIELCLVAYQMFKFPPFLLAAVAIYTAPCSLYQFKQWTKTIE